jgi:signal transduction histidine kinase/CheY-like chemotaxis protein
MSLKTTSTAATASTAPTASTGPSKTISSSSSSSSSPTTSTLTTAVPDWTAALPQTDHVRFFRNTRWQDTALGPLTSWSPELRLFTTFVLAESRAACLWWGDSLIAIYNQHYAPLACKAHPRLMGRTFREGYPELWPSISAYFDKCRTTASGVNYSSSASLVVERKGWREETFFSGNFVPVGPPFAPHGFYNSMFEVTAQSLADRRTSMLNTLASPPSLEADTVTTHILATLATNSRDVPLALLYRLHDNAAAAPELTLEGSYGLPDDHPLRIQRATLDSNKGLIPDMRRAGTAITSLRCDARLDGVTWGGWGAPSRTLAIVPLTGGPRLFGYLVVGTNPYRPHDDSCHQFTRDLARIASSIVMAAVDADLSKRRQEQLEADLAFSNLKLRHLIDHASVGMCHISLAGDMIWANDHYYALAGLGPDEHAAGLAFLNAYCDEDRPKALNVWNRLLAGVDHVTAELRVNRLYSPPVGDTELAQIQVLAFPYREHGRVQSIMACTTDISRLKWAQSFQARLAAEAREAKRQQEAFIDVVSHEMRNPLSAIVHCADAINTAVEECQTQLANIPAPCLDALNDNVASANIIMQCANHQKRIIDDVLTLSRLDSMLLSITPIAVKPTQLIDSVVNIFEAELKSSRIGYSVKADRSLNDLHVDYIHLDPSRVTQIFINLLTNAIKFVKPSKEPHISIAYGVCLSNPRSKFPSDMFWATDSKQDANVTSSPEWGSGEEMYLVFSVKDSGIGLQEQEIHNIFERFKQANVKTHVKYGGSGLGLFISKELTEKQGGEIGVSSVHGQGSTFGFYVKTRRVERRFSVDAPGVSRGSVQNQDSLRVLLVEDNLINQKVLGKQLKKANYKVEVANHGQEALDTLETETFDVVLMDLEMPVLDGLAAIQAIRKKEASEEIADEGLRVDRLPIIAVTANVRKEQIDTAIAAGADRVMQKPFKARDLVYMIKSLLPQVEVPSPVEDAAAVIK